MYVHDQCITSRAYYMTVHNDIASASTLGTIPWLSKLASSPGSPAFSSGYAK